MEVLSIYHFDTNNIRVLIFLMYTELFCILRDSELYVRRYNHVSYIYECKMRYANAFTIAKTINLFFNKSCRQNNEVEIIITLIIAYYFIRSFVVYV